MTETLTPEQRQQKLRNGRIRYSLNIAAMARASDHRWHGYFANACMRHDLGTLLPWERPSMDAYRRRQNMLMGRRA